MIFWFTFNCKQKVKIKTNRLKWTLERNDNSMHCLNTWWGHCSQVCFYSFHSCQVQARPFVVLYFLHFHISQGSYNNFNAIIFTTVGVMQIDPVRVFHFYIRECWRSFKNGLRRVSTRSRNRVLFSFFRREVSALTDRVLRSFFALFWISQRQYVDELFAFCGFNK